MPEPLIGEHPSLRHVRKRIPHLAASGEPLVIVGEHGTGKSLVAEHIHAQSPFARDKLVTVDCTLLDDRDQLNLLFGDPSSERRSPLHRRRMVVIKNPLKGCDGFKDLLLNALNTGMAWNFRSRSYVPIAARVILILDSHPVSLQLTTTLDHRLAKALIQCRSITLPPLSKRKGDILLLTRHFIAALSGEEKGRVFRGVGSYGNPTKELRSLLLHHHWERNILELKAFIRRLIIEKPEDLLDESKQQAMTEAQIMIEGGRGFDVKAMVARIESLLVADAVRQNKGKKLTTSYLLGISRRSIHRYTSRK
ncbi:MAG: sigma 54-interacting transcriptional regulator [Bacteroidetes bacterium]|nr:sigma 54-interacting transcriptional regulator [Bacteroidota bacterium]MCW5896704.1 sigma 54-interacting transcriptional regulator [Bacteroidota bacterium]